MARKSIVVAEPPPQVATVFAHQIEVWPLTRFIMYAGNPRKHKPIDIDKMAASLLKFGFPIPLLACKTTGEVVDGHLRLKGAKKANLPEAPFINCDDWTPEQVKAFRLMANRSVNWAEWDTNLLGSELEELKTAEFDLSLTGFDDHELNRYLNQMAALDDSHATPQLGAALLYKIIVTCENEKHQREALKTLEELGLICQLLIS